MTEHTLFVGLDVHKKTISVAMVEAAAGAQVRLYGTIAHTPDMMRALCRKLSRDGQQLHFAYEAGPCGYGVQRLLTRLGHRREVVIDLSGVWPGSKLLGRAQARGYTWLRCQVMGQDDEGTLRARWLRTWPRCSDPK